MDSCNANDGSLFPDVKGPLEIKKKYAKLYKEVNSSIEKIRDHRVDELKDSLKAVRKMVNVLCVYIKKHCLKENTSNPTSINPKTTEQNRKLVDPEWIVNARTLASHHSRTSVEIKQIKKRRLEIEQKDGIITMPLLEPYLDIKWPSKLQMAANDINPVIKEYSAAIRAKEESLLANKRFGL